MDDDAQGMAQLMGFSAFGSQDHPAKKRRYNPNVDASLPQTPNVPPSHSSASASGANSAPLGERLEKTNTDEIALDDDEDDQEPQQKQEAAATAPAPAQVVAGVANLPARPGPPVERAPRGAGHGARGGRAQGRGGQGHNPLWYEGYYDPMSNENPWERLEKSIGLKAKGPWLARGHHNPATSKESGEQPGVVT